MEAIAVTYESTIQGITLEPDEKQALYQTLCVLSCNPDEPVTCSVSKLSSQWTAVVERYREARAASSRP
jgi:hypothetical protein